MSADRNRSSLAGSRIGAPSGSQLPRRAPSPSSAAFASAEVPANGSAAGPASRISARTATATAAGNAPSRFGFQGRPVPSAALAKRTSTAAGLSADGPGAGKRPLSGASGALQRPASRASLASNAGSDINGVAGASADASASVPDHLLSGPPSESAEYLLSVMKNEYERRLLAKDQQYAVLQKDLSAKVRELSKAERRTTEIAEEWERERLASSTREEEAASARERLRAELEDVRVRYSDLDQRHAALEAESSTREAARHEEVHTLRLAQTQMEAELAHVRAEEGRARERAEGAEAERDALEKVLEAESARGAEREEKLREVATGWGSREEAEAVQKEIKRQALHIRDQEETIAKLKAENKYLADGVTNAELLREEKRSLESKLRAMDELRQAQAVSEAKAQTALDTIAAWTDAISNVLASGPDAHLVSQILETETVTLPTPPSSPLEPASVREYLHQSLAVQSGLAARVSASAQTMTELRARLAEAEEAQMDQGRERDAMGRALAEEKARSARALGAEERLKGEVARCKAILDSYEAEQQTFKTKEGGGGSFSEADSARLKSLEALVEEQRQQCDALGSELEAVRKELAGANESLSHAVADAGAAQKVKDLQQALETTKAEYDQLLKDAEQLSLENEKLLTRVGRGEFDTSKEKCWSLTNNPASRHFAVRTATLEALKKENEDLLKRLDELNAELSKAAASAKASEADASGVKEGGAVAAGGDDGAALVPRQVVENYKKEMADLQLSIKQKDKSMLRLKQVFTAKATEFREVVQSLFGYKIRFLENGKVKLSSVYAPSSKGRGTNIIFQSNSDNTAKMQLLLGDDDGDGGPLRDLQWLRDYWLGEERHNVPCFLAALSKELYEAVTRVEKRGAWRMEIGEDAIAADEDAVMQQ